MIIYQIGNFRNFDTSKKLSNFRNLLIYEIEQFQKFDCFINWSIYEISTRIWNKSWKVKASKLIYIKGQIWELTKSRVVRNIEWMNNCKIANFGSQIFIFQIEKNLEISLFSNLDNSKKFKFGKSEKFAIWQILKIVDLENSKNVQFVKFQKISIQKIKKICNLKNAKNYEFGNFKKFAIWKIRKTMNFQNFNNFQFEKFQKFAVWNFEKLWILKSSKICNV